MGCGCEQRRVKLAAAIEGAKAAAKLAWTLALTKLRANFRKWNRGETGKHDDAK